MKNITIILLFLLAIGYSQVVEGVSGGLVTTAPTADPTGTADVLDRQAFAQKVTIPDFEITITEIGWYSSNASDESLNYEVAIYDHDAGDDEPQNIVGSDLTNQDGTTEGWKRSTGLNIVLSANTIYWIAVQLDNTALTAKRIDQSSVGGKRYIQEITTASLKDPWGEHDPYNIFTSTLNALYALYEPPVLMQINIGDVWKEVSGAQINIGDSWKEVVGIQINIGDTWKEVY